MAHNFPNTPQTDAVDRTRATLNLDFSELPSFLPPDGNDDLVKAVRGRGSRYVPLRTPSARAPLVGRPNPPAKQEFTPLLKSATRNQMLQHDRDRDTKENGLATPAALKPDFRLSSPMLPEHSILGESESVSVDQTPIPLPESSSSMSTPLPALPRRGEMGLGANNGNLLTLKEQEAKLEQIDKENFGLKLKIHFLEEHLRKSGSEFNQQTIKENADLRTKEIVHERDIKRYHKQLRQAEIEIEQYRLQLEELIEKVKTRHVNEAMRDEIDKYKTLAVKREQQIIELKTHIENVQHGGNTEELDVANGHVEDLEAELHKKQQIIDEKDERIEELEAKLRDGQTDDDGELAQKDEQIETQQQEIEQLQREIQQFKEEQEELHGVQDNLDVAKQEHEAEIQEFRTKLETAIRSKRDQLHEFEERLLTTVRDKEVELQTVQRRLQNVEDEKNSEIESLELRLKIAESQGDNQSQLAQQATADAQEKLRILALQKDAEIETLQVQLDGYEGIKDELELVRRQWREANEDVERLQQEMSKQNQASAELRSELTERNQQVRTLRSPSKNDQVENLQRVIQERTSKIVDLQQTIESHAASLEELASLRTKVAEQSRRVNQTESELRAKHIEISDRDRQVESLRQTLHGRTSELEVLRNTTDERTQIGELRTIMRDRNQDLEDLRTKLNEQEMNMDKLQKVAEERLKSMEHLKDEFAVEKQDLVDEIEVLECSLDEAEKKLATLVKDLQGSHSPGKLEQLEKKIRAHERERTKLQSTIDELKRDQDIADSERLSLHDTIQKLRRDLKTSQDAANNASLLPKGSSTELKSLRIEQRDLQQRLRAADGTLESAESRHRQELKKLRQTLQDKESQVQELEADTFKHLQAGTKSQQVREDAGRLSAQVADLERKHIAEIKGLVKQIQVLRARLDREKLFRSELSFQKKWFLMMVDMYDTCNATNIRMIEEMGISPGHTFRNRRPSLKTVSHAVIFCLRAKKASAIWADSKRIQEALVRKMDIMRGRGTRMSIR